MYVQHGVKLKSKSAASGRTSGFEAFAAATKSSSGRLRWIGDDRELRRRFAADVGVGGDFSVGRLRRRCANRGETAQRKFINEWLLRNDAVRRLLRRKAAKAGDELHKWSLRRKIDESIGGVLMHADFLGGRGKFAGSSSACRSVISVLKKLLKRDNSVGCAKFLKRSETNTSKFNHLYWNENHVAGPADQKHNCKILSLSGQHKPPALVGDGRLVVAKSKTAVVEQHQRDIAAAKSQVLIELHHIAGQCLHPRLAMEWTTARRKRFSEAPTADAFFAFETKAAIARAATPRHAAFSIARDLYGFCDAKLAIVDKHGGWKLPDNEEFAIDAVAHRAALQPPAKN